MLNFKQELTQVIKALKAYQPEKIILFGSAALGTVSSASDADLLVIKKTNKTYWQRQIEAALLYKGLLPVDIFVLTPEEYDQAIAEKRFFLTEEILKKGKILYDKNNPSLSA